MPSSQLASTALLAAAMLNAPPTAAQSRIEVVSEPAVDTLSIVLELAENGPARWDDAVHRPLAAQARTRFADDAAHPAVALADELISDGFWFDRLIMATLIAPDALERPAEADDIPAVLARAAGQGDEALGRNRIVAFLQALAAFHREAGVADFLHQHAASFACARAEVTTHLPAPGFVDAMETYYGETRSGYSIVVAPIMFPGMGFGPSAPRPGGLHAYNVATPFISAETAAEYGCGYDDQQMVTELSRHEFGHSFVNPQVDALAPETLAAMEPLHAPMRPMAARVGYSSWTSVVAEHFVRLGEIQIAEALGETARADRLRLAYAFEDGFIYLPVLERADDDCRSRTPNADFLSCLPVMLDAWSPDAAPP
ncbi:MAG: DUF4932 domain-containing protein [Pseudomonadota bacterium]